MDTRREERKPPPSRLEAYPPHSRTRARARERTRERTRACTRTNALARARARATGQTRELEEQVSALEKENVHLRNLLKQARPHARRRRPVCLPCASRLCACLVLAACVPAQC